MKIQKGDMWSVFPEADLFLITTNSTLKANGELVMGAGIAKQAVERWCNLPTVAGAMVRAQNNPVMYGLIVNPKWREGKKLGFFQTKIHWSQSASLEVIEMATYKLVAFAKENPDAKIHLNYPGIGLGMLDPLHVAAIIKRLPDNVNVWRYAGGDGFGEEGEA